MEIKQRLEVLAKEAHVPVATVTHHFNYALSFLEKHTSCHGEEAVKVAFHDTVLEYKH